MRQINITKTGTTTIVETFDSANSSVKKQYLFNKKTNVSVSGDIITVHSELVNLSFNYSELLTKLGTSNISQIPAAFATQGIFS